MGVMQRVARVSLRHLRLVDILFTTRSEISEDGIKPNYYVIFRLWILCVFLHLGEMENAAKCEGAFIRQSS